MGTFPERNKIWRNELDPGVEAIWEQIHDQLCRHLVCFGVRYVPIDTRGNPCGPERLQRFSCFVVSVEDKWFLVTAGHAIKDVATHLGAKTIRIVRSFLVDYIGYRETVRKLTPFSFDFTEQQYVDEITLGLDYAFIPLQDLYRWGMEANGIKPISESHWREYQPVDFDVYAVLGLPEQVASGYDPAREGDHPLSGSIGSVVLSAEVLTDKSQIPESVNPGLVSGPWFTGVITAQKKLNIVGMSGGPIVGICKGPDDWVGYSVVAIQSRWHEATKIIFGCPITLFGEMVDRYAAELLAKR